MTAGGVLSRIVRGSRLKYLGLSFVLTWHYCLWFVPGSFPDTFLLDDRITFSWLIALACTVLTVGLLALVLGQKRHFPRHPAYGLTVCAGGSVATAALTMGVTLSPVLVYAAAVVVGVSAGLLWVMWGERLSRQHAKFTMLKLAPTYGVTLLAGLAWTFFAPGLLAPILVSLLPLASGALLFVSWRRAPVFPFTPVLPRPVARQAYRSIGTVGAISFVAVFMSYFVVAIVPWSDLWDVGRSFTLGVAIGAVFVLIIAIAQLVTPARSTAFRLFPWLLFLIIIACLLCALGMRLDFVGFLLALAVSSVFEVLFVLYMARLTLSGYIAAAAAFGLSAATIRLGICLGNAMALTYERVPPLLETMTVPTLLVFMAILAGLLIPLVRQEYTINDLARSPQDASEWDTIVSRTAEEFRLSTREKEIVELLGRGYTASAIAEKLVISPHTVNTHVQHIYDKMGIHKRSELLDYLNKR